MTPAPLPAPSPRILRALVRGAGPTGSLAALALADAGWAVTLVDPASRDQILRRSRAYAFTHSSRNFLQRLGIWRSIAPILEPFDSLHLDDPAAGEASHFGPGDLGGGPAGQPVGWIGEHRRLMEALLQLLEAQPGVQLLLGEPADGTRDTGAAGAPPDWILAADGGLSPTRTGLGIGVWRHPYAQHCLTAQVGLRGAAAHTAWERLRPEGPFALLPMGGGRFQVVWSAPAWRCRQLVGLSPVAFLDALAPILPGGVDVESLEEAPQVFPVGLLLARRLHRGRTILLGETAHHCHPVGGQGLNLCWRDVAVLHRLAQRTRAGRLPVASLGRAYGRRRWADLLLTLLITDSLVRIFSNRHPLLLPVRRRTVRQLERVPALRRLLLGVMTHGPCQPLAAAAT